MLGISAFTATSVLASMVTATVQTTVEENWRGIYDVLVTAPGEDFGAGETLALVDQNFVSATNARGISATQLSRVRDIEAIEVAAPIGMVGVLRQSSYSPYLAIADDVYTGATDLPADQNLLKLNVTLTADTGLGPQELLAGSGLVFLSHRTKPDTIDSPPELAATSNAFGPMALDQGYLVQLGVMPSLATSVVAIDPQAEMALRGEGASGLFEVFEGLPQDRALTVENGWAGLLDESRHVVQQATIESLERDPQGAPSTAVPLLVNAQPLAPLTFEATVGVAAIDTTATPTGPGDLDRLAMNAQFADPFVLTKDMSAMGVPFSTPDVELRWPNSLLREGSLGAMYLPATNLSAGIVDRPTFTGADDPEGLGFAVVPVGTVNADGTGADTPGLPGMTLSPTTSYRTLTSAAGPGFAAAAPVPVGTFEPEYLVDPRAADAGYTPTGMVGTQPAIWVDGDGVVRHVDPQYNGVDFLTAPPGAITDLAGGEQLRGSAPIDAIRVRVSGVTGYDEAGVGRVAAVAAEIERLGLNVRIVAGSSLQPVDVFVANYWHTADGAQTDLGWVQQEWTSLGAAVNVTRGLNAVNEGLITGVLALYIVGGLILAVFVGIGRRTEVGVLATVGWSRRSVVGSLIAREAPGVVLTMAVIIVGVTIGGAHLAMWGAIVVGGAIAALVAGTIAALARTGLRQPSPRREVTSIHGIAYRTMSVHWGRTALNVGGAVALFLVATLTTFALTVAWQEVGSTRLAVLAGETTLPWLLLLGGTGLAVTLLVLLTAARAAQRTRARQRSALTLAGHGQAFLRRLDAISRATSGGLNAAAILLAALICVVAGISWTIVAIGAVIALASSLAATLLGRSRPS